MCVLLLYIIITIYGFNIYKKLNLLITHYYVLMFVDFYEETDSDTALMLSLKDYLKTHRLTQLYLRTINLYHKSDVLLSDLPQKER